MFIHRKDSDLMWQIRQLETEARGDISPLGADYGAFEPDIDGEGRLRGRRNWRIKERTRVGAQRFGTTFKDSWMPFMGGTGGASVSVWGLNEAFAAYLPDAPWLIPVMLGGLVGWKAGEWGNKATVGAINQISRPIRAFRETYYFKI
jgi:hypothetical protein